jgi:hypothetical protein
MIVTTKQPDIGILNSCRLLLLIFLLSLWSVCHSDDQLPEAVDPVGRYQPEQIGEPGDGKMKEKPAVEDLGNEKYRIGEIKIDKAKHLITIPGVMLPNEQGKAIEFIASTNNGYKAYESVVMLNANAFEFNLACILIGLDSRQSTVPEYHFDPEPVKGDPVSIKIAWEKNGKPVEYDVIELLKVGETKPAKPSVWSYTGSMFVDGDQYLAEMDGVLIGLVHNPASIIEHRAGLGLGNWGAVTIDSNMAPENGQAIRLMIQALEK